MGKRQPDVYAVKHMNEGVVGASRSGGIFTAVSDWVFEKNGVVYGCVLDEHFKAVHIRAESAEGRNLMRGSKYIQSKLGDTYKNVKEDLQNARFVLFSGTSCQIAGLKTFLGKDYENLLCIDIVCHGVPSPKVWEAYLRWQEKKYSAKVKGVDFRNKKDFGWRAHMETLEFDNGKAISSNMFTTLFYGHSILRPSCYECPYKSVTHPGDITIADYWGIEKAAPEFDDNKGVSLVLINTASGKAAFDFVKESIIWKETRLEDSMQPPLKAPFPEPQNRSIFWNDFQTKGFEYVLRKYCGFGAVNKLKAILGKMKRKIIG